ncbi:MAG: hypothetical protein AAF934_00350 [Bacteroidota bacterium]
MELTRELFIETLEQMEIQHDHDMVFSEFIAVICGDDIATKRYKNDYLRAPLIKLLQLATNDFPGRYGQSDGLILYFIYQLDFGRGYAAEKVSKDMGREIDLSDAGKLWDCLSQGQHGITKTPLA